MKKALLILGSMLMFVSVATAQKTYVGTETCLTCHNGAIASDKASWRNTLHANGYSDVTTDAFTMVVEKGIICDADGNGIDDFHDGLDLGTSPFATAFEKYGANAPKLNYSDADGYTITIGNEVMRVYMTYGGSGMWKQRYALKIVTTEGESNDFYISPVQYNEKTNEYVAYHPDAWYDDNDEPIYDPATSTLADAAGNSRSFAKGCVGCHVTGLEVAQDANGEWIANSAFQYDADDARIQGNPSYFDLNGDGKIDEINTACETCHGPGSEHNGNPVGIINPERDMTPEQINNLCGMCHSRGKSMPNHTFGYPFDDASLTRWTPQDIIDGELTSDYYDFMPGLWGDNSNSSAHHQQFLDLYQSEKPTFEFHKVTCIDCHDAHGSENEHMIVEDREEEDSNGNPIVVNTEPDNNTLCLSCHATHGDFEDISVEMVADYANNVDGIGTIVSAHTHHPYDPEGNGASRCTKCHMPKVAKSAIKYDIHSHTFEAIPPEKTKIFDMPNSCAVSCHGVAGNPAGDFDIGITEADFTDWGGANQQLLADKLMEYYGPDGTWWQHVVSVEKEDNGIPENYALSQNYPNPFNPSTTIEFAMPESDAVSLVVYDILGKQVKVLINDQVPAGSYRVTWDASQVASGVYIYRMQTGSFVQSKKMILTK
ncbi:MAG: T9SS type A sorting domain-containing protein [Chlorobi bacterium]|nr:T9SS type A sorting domain-containing protein [Chlorobiota bacterium]